MSFLIKILIWVFCFVLLYIFVRYKFNQPPTQRSETTWRLFYFGLALYYVLSIMIWVLVAGLLYSGLPIARNIHIDFSNFYIEALPIIALLFVILSNTLKVVQRLDTSARKLCSKMAAIPSEKDRLVIELRDQSKFCLENRSLQEEIKAKANKFGIPTDKLEFFGTLPHALLTKTFTLYYIIFCCSYKESVKKSSSSLTFDGIIATKHYRRFFSSPIYQKHLLEAKEKFESFLPFAKEYLIINHPSHELNRDFIKKNSEVFNALADIIARALLSIEKNYSEIYSRLEQIGFVIETPFRPLSINQYAGFLIGAFFIYCAFFLITSMEINHFAQQSFKSILIAVDITVSILFAIVAAQFQTKKIPDSSGFPPIVLFAGVSVLTFLVVFSFRFSFRCLQECWWSGFDYEVLHNAFLVVKENWTKRFLPFFLTFSLSLACWYSIRQKRRNSNITIMITSFIVVANLLLGLLLIYLLSLSGVGKFMSTELPYVIIIVIVVGAGVGAVVPHLFRKSYFAFMERFKIS